MGRVIEAAVARDVKKLVLQARERPVEEKPLVFRNDANSLRLAAESLKQERDKVS